MYGSFGRISVITYWCVDNYGCHLWQKNISIFHNMDTSYNVNGWPKPQPEMNKKCMCVYGLYVINWIYNILIVPLHLFQDDAVFIVTTLKPFLFQENIALFQKLQHTLIRWNRFDMRHQTIAHRGGITYKGWGEGMVARAWVPRELFCDAGIRSTCNTTIRISEYIPAFCRGRILRKIILMIAICTQNAYEWFCFQSNV